LPRAGERPFASRVGSPCVRARSSSGGASVACIRCGWRRFGRETVARRCRVGTMAADAICACSSLVGGRVRLGVGWRMRRKRQASGRWFSLRPCVADGGRVCSGGEASRIDLRVDLGEWPLLWVVLERLAVAQGFAWMAVGCTAARVESSDAARVGRLTGVRSLARPGCAALCGVPCVSPALGSGWVQVERLRVWSDSSGREGGRAAPVEVARAFGIFGSTGCGRVVPGLDARCVRSSAVA
jgi:hypothetical protein